MEIKDYLHFYIGCLCKVYYISENFQAFTGLRVGDEDVRISPQIYVLVNDNLIKVKPILRKLSDMTEKDGLAIFGSETKYLLYRKEARELGADLWLFTANEYTRLLKAGFDCHDLIPNGLAIDNKSL